MYQLQKSAYAQLPTTGNVLLSAKGDFMKKFLLFLVFVLFSSIVYSVGGWDEGGWDEGGWDFGTPAPESAPSPSSSSGGGGSGGGGGTYIPKDFTESITYNLNLIKGQVYNFNVNGKINTLEIREINVDDEIATILFKSESTELILKLNASDYINYDNDNFYDLELTLTKIYGSELVEIKIRTIHLGIPFGGEGGILEPIQEPIQEPKKYPTGKVILWLVIIIIIFFIIYIAMQEWYKRRYEKHLFKNPDDLYNLLNFIYNSRKAGISDNDIRNKLRAKSWSSEQITYALRKISGKRTGMYEIPIFKFLENKKVKEELSRRQTQPLDARFIKSSNL